MQVLCHRKSKMESRRSWRSNQKCWLYLIINITLIDLTIALPITTTTTEQPKPFQFAYAAGRAPGGKPDRYVEQQGDGTGQIRGSYTYLDPNWTWQTIKYVADPDGGFRILEGSSLGSLQPKDTLAVAKAKQEHEALFKMIALRNEQPIHSQPVESLAVQEKRRQHAELFQKIAEEHRLLAEEHKRLAAVNQESQLYS